MLEPQSVKYLRQLKKNNNKTWFDANRVAYEAARTDFRNFIQLVIDALKKSDPDITGQEARDCIFRINRDIRFSKDKTPYKTAFGASIKRGGKKSPYAGYYFHFEPGQSFSGGGLWMPEAPVLKNIRQEIDYNLEEFHAIVNDRNFKKHFGKIHTGGELSLQTMPRGYAADHPASVYLKLKSVIAERTITDEELTKSSLHRTTVAAFTALQPLLNFLNRAVETTE